MLNVTQLKASGNVSIGLVAANVQLGQARATYEITGIGISDAGILTALPDPGDFNFDSYRKILEATATVKKYMADHTDKLVAKPFAVSLTKPPSADRVERAHSVVFAMRRLLKRVILADAIKAAGVDTDVSILREVYATFAGITDENQRPDNATSDRAQDWLNT